MKYLHAPGNGISTIAVNPSYGLIAFGENGLNAKIFIYETNNLEKPLRTIPGKCFSPYKLHLEDKPISNHIVEGKLDFLHLISNLYEKYNGE